MAASKTKQCKQCKKNRSERFFRSPKARYCSTCLKANRSRATHDRRVSETYGLEPGEYAVLFAAQGGKCAICKESRRERLSVDHDHKTGLVRMLACRRCNNYLLAKGARDRPEVLRAAADALENPPALRILGERYHIDFKDSR
ncbi:MULTISPECIES: endonuclease domain-containing protein [Actinocorallia]|uniref:Recombination endonuclease VII n=2 Tax=Actinocorallia TaxID=58108 RepID=A0ABN3UTW6_9ACTN